MLSQRVYAKPWLPVLSRLLKALCRFLSVKKKLLGAQTQDLTDPRLDLLVAVQGEALDRGAGVAAEVVLGEGMPVL